MARTESERLAEKTAERQFLYELERDFELAPAASRAVLETAQQVLLAPGAAGSLREGQMRITAVSVHEPSGKPLAAMKKVTAVVTVDSGLEDLDALRRFGMVRQRRLRLLRISEEVVDQDGALTQEDLARVLRAEPRTIRRDIAALRHEGHWVPTRGAVKEIGRGQSHKAKIVELYLRRMTYSEIVRRARHSPKSIKRYVETFGRVVVLWEKGMRVPGEIAFVTGISERLAREYLALRERYDTAEHRDRLKEIARQVRRALSGEGEEKRLLSDFGKRRYLSYVPPKRHPSSTRKNTEGNGPTHEAPCVHRLFGEVAHAFPRNLAARHPRSALQGASQNPEFSAKLCVFPKSTPVFTEF